MDLTGGIFDSKPWALAILSIGMTAFVESCVQSVSGPAAAAERRARNRPRAKQLLRALAGKKNILLTTHQHPDPDALASCLALCLLLTAKLPRAKVSMSVKGRMITGVNEQFIRNSNLTLLPWDDSKLADYDAIILLDVQPQFAYSPLPADMPPFAVIDHHRSPARKRPKCAFCDIRTDAGATASIVFSYFMELEQPISPSLAATLLYAIESDLAGAAGTPGELDNLALSTLTLLADTRKLYQMRYVALPQAFYQSFALGLQNATYYDNALISHIDTIDSVEKPAIVADFLLRFDKVNWALVSAIYEGKFVLSVRTSDPKRSAADMIKRLLKDIGEGGGHRTKAGGFIPITDNTPAEIDRIRKMLVRRYLRVLHIRKARAQKLVTQ
jgi:nanoRNase/pAp phosphatase (c-di-AMP/oligoRNAs hydrolase)